MHPIAQLLLPFGTTEYVCPLCDELGCCEHKPVCDYEGECPDCGTEKPRVDEALALDPDAVMLALEIQLRHKGDMTTEAGDGFLTYPPPDGEHLSHKQGVRVCYPLGTCPKCENPVDIPLVYGYLSRPCPGCGALCCVHSRPNDAPGGRSYPFVVRTYCRATP